MRGKQFAHAFFIEMNRLLSRTGSPCVHKGDWEYFPNKQNRGYHGVLLSGSTKSILTLIWLRLDNL